MKTLVWYGATAVAVGVAATMSGQSESPHRATSSSYIETSKLVGKKVRSLEGEDIGVIKDLVIDSSNGCMAYTVLSTGGEGTGVVSGGGKLVAVPWALYSPRSDLTVFTVNVDREKIYNSPTFDYPRMDEYARPDYMDNVYSYYGVSPGPPTAAAASSGAKLGKDATGTAGATASPGEVVSALAAAARTNSPNKKPSASTPASSAVTNYGASGPNPSSKAIRSPRSIYIRQSVGRGENSITDDD